MPKTSHVTRQYEARSIIDGITKRLPAGDKLWIDRKEHTAKSICAIFQEELDALDAIRTARAALSTAVAKERATAKKAQRAAQVLQTYVKGRLGAKADVFADFGWKLPKKPGPKTSAAKLSGVLKGAATRKARGTIGSRQRLKIKGTLPTN